MRFGLPRVHRKRSAPGRSAPRRRHAARLPAIAATVVCAAAATEAPAGPVERIRALEESPIAPIGGVMMLPLGAMQPGDGWPTTMDLLTGDGTTIPGQVVWVHAGSTGPITPQRWASTPLALAVRPIAPGDDSGRADLGAPYLLARMPRTSMPLLQFGDQLLRPIWRDPRRTYTFEALPGLERPVLERTDAPDRPDPDSPFAYWRWMLLADRLDHRPPPLDGFDETEALVAEHYAQLWRIALGHLAEHSMKAAESCRDLLTRICTDRPHRFAAWISEPASLEELLSALLDFRRKGPKLVSDAMAWVETRPALAAWSEAEESDHVRLALLNRGFSLLVVRLTWDGIGLEPVTVELPPGVLTAASVERPNVRRLPSMGRPGQQQDPDIQFLTAKAGHDVLRLSFGPRAALVRPPGVVMPPFRRPLTLPGLDAQRLRAVPAEYTTIALLRRLMGRWELFIDCRRPNGGAPGATDPLGGFASAETVRGVEAITLFFGPADAPTAVLGIPERGATHLFLGASGPTLEVHRQSYADRWYCRIVLPPEWLDGEPGSERLRLAGRRSHAGGDAVETTPNTSAPWRHRVARVTIDLSRWDERRGPE